MTWADVYMFCFLVGFILSLMSLVIGVFNIHIPGLHHVHFDHGHIHFDHAHGPDIHIHTGHAANGEAVTGISPFNFSTAMAFLAWFGGAGYLLTAWGKIGTLAVLAFAAMAGATGAAIVFAFLAKVLMRTDSTLHDADYRMDGVLGHVSVGIREGGTGEIIFSQEGVRRPCGARSENGTAIARGTEVVITRYEKGIAYVRRWDEVADEAGVSGSVESK
jgi:membrane protein implicated in regulation of membrane protease activity